MIPYELSFINYIWNLFKETYWLTLGLICLPIFIIGELLERIKVHPPEPTIAKEPGPYELSYIETLDCKLSHILIGYDFRTFEYTTIEVDLYPDEGEGRWYIPKEIKCLKVQSEFYLGLHWRVDSEGQMRGYASFSSENKDSKAHQYSKGCVFTEGVKEIITGMILGDSCIAFANPNSKIARFQVDQQDREFVQHLWDIFDSIGLVVLRP